jgi:hypothetical protein
VCLLLTPMVEYESSILCCNDVWNTDRLKKAYTIGEITYQCLCFRPLFVY